MGYPLPIVSADLGTIIASEAYARLVARLEFLGDGNSCAPAVIPLAKAEIVMLRRCSGADGHLADPTFDLFEDNPPLTYGDLLPPELRAPEGP